MNIGDMAVKCVMCGYTSQQTIIFQAVRLELLTLDTRPPETTRSGVVFHVQQCPKCHYCNSDISEAIPGVSAANSKTKLIKRRLTTKQFILISKSLC